MPWLVAAANMARGLHSMEEWQVWRCAMLLMLCGKQARADHGRDPLQGHNLQGQNMQGHNPQGPPVYKRIGYGMGASSQLIRAELFVAAHLLASHNNTGRYMWKH